MATAPKDARFTVMSTDPLIYSRPVASKQNWTFAAKKLTIHTNSETDLKLSVVFVPIHKGEGNVVPTEIPFQALDNWTVASEKEALLSSLKIDNKSLANFDERNFTYDIDLKDAKVPLIKATSENKASIIGILQATSIPGKAEISVSADGMQPTTYCVYFREKTPQIISSTAKEYSSWDESFADHRISALPISAGKYLEYDLGETSKVGALTIGVRQQMKYYKFELLASDDMESWNSVYVGQTKVVDGLKVAMPQAFSFPVFKTRYIRVKCPENSSTFTVDIIRFHKDEVAANDYVAKAYCEILADVTINQGEINLKSGAKIKLKLEGISNYKRLVDLADATIRFESEKPQVATVSSTGEILAIEDGEARIRIVIQKGVVVIHKKILVKVQNSNAIKCLASCTVNLKSNQSNKNFINDKDITIDDTNVSLLRFNLKDLDGKSFSKAVIRLYAANTSFEPIENKLYLTTNDWSQSTVNFANKPVQGELITTFNAPTNITDYVDVDITSIIKEKLKADSEISLILGANSKISYSGVSEKDLKPLLIVF